MDLGRVRPDSSSSSRLDGRLFLFRVWYKLCNVVIKSVNKKIEQRSSGCVRIQRGFTVGFFPRKFLGFFTLNHVFHVVSLHVCCFDDYSTWYQRLTWSKTLLFLSILVPASESCAAWALHHLSLHSIFFAPPASCATVSCVT